MRGSVQCLTMASAVLAALLCARPVAAQAPPILPSTRVVQAGPASLYPAIALRNVGTDSNVYNAATAPQEDFTYSVTPRLYAVVPIGHGRFIGTAKGDFVYFRTHKDQQSINAFLEGRYDVVEAPVRPFVAASVATYRDRQGHEIDARVRQRQTAMTLGGEIELTPITSLTGWVQRQNTTWDPNELYRGVSLAEQLDSTADVVAAGARFHVTPLTSIVAVAEIQRDRFEASPERDADSFRVGPTAEFANGGAITGRAQGGYRAFRPLTPGFGGYNGFAGMADVRYEFLDLTQVYVNASRDVEFSYDPLQPYYLETGVGFRVVQHVVGPLEAIAVGERWQLRYQRVGGTSFDGREETLTTIGGGVGFRLGEDMELTFTVDRTARHSSDTITRNYERRRVLASVNYGL